MRIKILNQWNELEPYIEMLQTKEVAHNLAIGLIKRNQESNEQDPLLFSAVFYERDEPVLLVLQSIKEQAILAVLSKVAEVELKESAGILAEQKITLPGIMGESPYADAFSLHYSELTKTKRTLHTAQRIYQLRNVRRPKDMTGQLRLSTEEDTEFLIKWAIQFGEDANVPLTEDEARERVERFFSQQSMYIWENEGKPVSMAASSRPTQTNINISLVFTPASERKKGYASACVASLSEKMLEAGYKTVSLYTDLANPTSNHIYQEIGYEMVVNSKLYYFQS
ncbi:GNAT family N-acetyltransferase [Alkalicoccobacillus gibsonii]|jgi:predicted GNAT family acetyltransferase|uniref:GNAT family N-acetyltransferase n=1 Tax=Alkalicoccobacillus gibsonii TaxID=79881 RepID=UPI001933058D|nr:GNAT family N-acetyltransferase [Alkalicoccobacillus gibsonii]MBM0067587.1 GNAT family N-acetyltransferase [Alkalicoccobacillus gibsonii]